MLDGEFKRLQGENYQETRIRFMKGTLASLKRFKDDVRGSTVPDMNVVLSLTALTRFRRAISWKPTLWWRFPGSCGRNAAPRQVGSNKEKKTVLKNTPDQYGGAEGACRNHPGEIKDPRIAPYSVVAVEVSPGSEDP